MSQWDYSGRVLLWPALFLVLIAAAAYFVGIPLLASFAANRLPAGALDAISAQTLRSLEQSVLAPSELPDGRREALAAAFAGLRWPDGQARPQTLHFRKSDRLGANALALPSGDVIVTDALVTLASDDREVLAVLAHEAGHVQRRHGMRSVIQASALTLLLSWLVGDVNAIAGAASGALLEARYSRGFERDADDYALRALRLNGIPPRYFVDALTRLQADQARRGQGDGGLASYLSTHPTTEERVRRLREQAGEPAAQPR